MADSKRKRKSWRPQGRKRPSPESDLQLGMRGVLITCDTLAERKAIREAFSVLGAAWEALLDSSGAPARRA